MLCDICKKNPATVHLTEMTEGKAKKSALCEACFKAKAETKSDTGPEKPEGP